MFNSNIIFVKHGHTNWENQTTVEQEDDIKAIFKCNCCCYKANNFAIFTLFDQSKVFKQGSNFA